MKCPNCGSADLRVIDSRPAENNAIKRRRECASCKARYTTYETMETYQLIVVKKNGSKQLFDKQKLLSGLMKACEKRPVNAETIASEIEAELHNSLRQEVTSGDLGEMVMRKLKEADDVAYVRFASVYREFKDIETFIKELNEIKKTSSD